MLQHTRVPQQGNDRPMSENAPPVVELVNLSKTYGRRGGGVRAVRGVSLTVAPGEVYGFLGPNGAGKSTTIRMMLGLIAPSGGEVRLFGEDLRRNASVLRRVGSLVDRVAIVSKGEVVRESGIAELLRQDAGLRVEAAPLDVAEAALAARWKVERSGDALLVDATKDEAPEVARRLIGAGANLFALAAEERNLEDVFLSITQPEAPDA